MSKMIVTMAYGSYWDLYGERFETMCDALEEKPDRVVVFTDKPIKTKYENIVHIPENGLDDYALGSYRQRSLELCDCDWLIQFDIDDIMYPNYISNLNEDADCHIFSVKYNEHATQHLEDCFRRFYEFQDIPPFGGYMNSAFKTSTLRKIGGYKTNFGWEDIILMCDLLHSKAKIHIDTSVLRGERLLHNNASSITKASTEKRMIKADQTKEYFQRLKMTDRKHEIQRLYKLMLGREADEGGLHNYLNSNLSLYDIQMNLWQSEEFKNKFKQNAYEPATLDNKLPIFIVNLERRPDRKQLIESRLANLGIKNYDIIKAVDGRDLPDDTSEFYNRKDSVELTRELKKSEIACALSHIAIAKKIIDDNLDYAIVLEDDAELTLEFKQFIKDFTIESNKFDFLILGGFSSNQFFNGKLKTKESPYKLIEKESITYLDKIEFNIGKISIHKPYYPSVKIDFNFGTHAYMVSNNGAKKILELNYPVRVEADNVWNYFHDECKLLFTNPILAHRQHEDSDIMPERSEYLHNFEPYSDSFKSRKYHEDFGT